MKPDQLRTLSDLLDQVLDLPLAEREAWLASLSGDALALAPTLRELLAKRASKETGELIDQLPAFTAPAMADARGSDFAPGATVGPYRLRRELGRGGMGEVWLAERADGSLRRKVALKLPYIGWVPGLAERFAREREILAGLEHPHIARLYDAGFDPTGRPYMALEFVDGKPIDEFCRQRALDVPSRLRLLLQVAGAVAFAHSRLVVHRDLKPSNIMVTDDGQVRLLDFGIAKLMESGSASETALTQASGRALTLDYSSPEQIRGEPIGTASDVYSLGVVAYRLLASAGPYKLKRQSAAALEEAIAELDVPLASDSAEDPALKKLLRGDLDAILSKALKKRACERYATVDAMAQDWRHHLEGQRVLARPDTLAYRVLRLARRHRGPLAAAAGVVAALALAIGLGAAAVVVAALSAGLGAALLQARRAAKERDRALRLAERNAAGNLFLDTLLTKAARGGPLTALQLVERSERLVDSEVKDNAEHRAFVLGLIANLYSQLDQPARAEPLFVRALEAASLGADPALRDSLASRRALTAGRLGRSDEAVATMDAILARTDPGPEVRYEVHAHRSLIGQWAGDFPGALHHAAEALRWYRAAHRLPHRQEPVLLALLGFACLKNGNGEDAERHYAASAAAFEALGLTDSAPALQHGSNRALMYQELGDLCRSIELFDEVLTTSLRAAPDLPPSVFLLANRAYTLAHAGRFDEAENAYRDSAALAGQQEQKLLRYNIRLLSVELNVLRQRPDAARRELQAAEAERDFEAPEGGPAVFARQQAEARLALLEGHPELAVSVFSDALHGFHIAAGTANALLGRAAAHELAGALELAATDARDALDVAQKLQGRRPSSFRTGLAWLALARVHARRGNGQEARRCAREALPQLRAQIDVQHPALADAQRLAEVDSVLGAP